MCRTARGSICFLYGKAFLGCETFRQEKYQPARGSICLSSGIAFSGCETLKYGSLSSNVVDLLNITNRVLRMRIVQKWGVLSRNGVVCWCSGFANRVAKRSNVGSDLIKGLRFSDSQESRFEVWKRSYMASAVMHIWRFANVQELLFILQTVQEWTVPYWKGVYSLIVRNGVFSLRKNHIRAVTSCKMVDLLMLKNRVSRVQNTEIRAVLYSNEVDMLMLTNHVFRLRIVQKWLVLSHKGVDLLMLRNRLFRLQNVQMWAVPSWKTSICWCSGNAFSEIETLKYWQCSSAMRFICWFSGVAFSGCEMLKYAHGVQKRGPFAEAQESRNQDGNRSKMVSAVPQGVWFADAH